MAPLAENPPATRKTEQTLDVFGNITQRKEYDYGNPNPGPLLRTYDMTYLGTQPGQEGYINRYIRNRLLTASVTQSSETRTLVSNTYDSIGLQDRTNPVPMQHDPVYNTGFTIRQRHIHHHIRFTDCSDGKV